MDYNKSAATALRLLTKYGQTVTLKQVTDGIPDLSTGMVTAGTVTSIAAKGVLLDFIYRTFGDKFQKGTVIKASDKRLLMSAGAKPTAKDTIIVNGIEYHIVDIKEVNPAGTSILYDIWMSV